MPDTAFSVMVPPSSELDRITANPVIMASYFMISPSSESNRIMLYESMLFKNNFGTFPGNRII